MSVVGCQWLVRTFVSVMNLSILSLYPFFCFSSDCKILLLRLHQLSLARVLVGDVLVGLLVCWCVGLLVCWCVGVLVVGVLVVGVLVVGVLVVGVITKPWWHEDFVLVSPGMAWRLRSLCHLGRVP